MKFKFGYVLLIIALALAGVAAFLSVWGLSKLFAGAATAVIYMGALLEIGKIATTTALHKYWSGFNRALKIYLTSAVIILMFITSVGIYGFLTNAYQATSNRLEIHEGELGVLDVKKMSFQKSVDDNEKNIISKNKRIDQLTNLRNNQETRLDSAKSTKSKDKARADIAEATKEIQKLSNDIDVLNTKDNVLLDSVNKYNVRMLDLKANSNVAAEVGPLKYISSITGLPMENVVNYLVLLLMFVIDPLAVALILATNRIFDIENGVTVIKKKPLITEGLNLDYDGVDEPVDAPSEDIETNEPIDISTKPETSGKVRLEDIKEIKEDPNRGYSVPIPKTRTSNTIQRVGTNKIIKNGDNDTFFFKKNK